MTLNLDQLHKKYCNLCQTSLLLHGLRTEALCRKRLAEPIWERARQAGAEGAREQRVYAIAEDISSAGLLVAYLSLAPFCAPGSISFTTVQRWGLLVLVLHHSSQTCLLLELPIAGLILSLGLYVMWSANKGQGQVQLMQKSVWHTL